MPPSNFGSAHRNYLNFLFRTAGPKYHSNSSLPSLVFLSTQQFPYAAASRQRPSISLRTPLPRNTTVQSHTPDPLAFVAPLPRFAGPSSDSSLIRMACCRGAKKSIWFIFKEFSIWRQPSCGYSAQAFNGSQLVGAREISKPPLTISLLRRFGSTASASEQMNLIRQLRERTSAPIKDVKSSLVSCNWNIEAAEKDLRKRGVVLASKKSSRTATEGLLAVAQTKNKAVVIELNCETDFVARNDIFQYLASSLARIALTVENPSQQAQVTFPFGYEYLENMKIYLDHPKLSGETTVESAITEVAAMVGENVKLRRGFALSASPDGVVCSYLHTCPQPGLGRIAGLLTLEAESSNASVDALQRVGSSVAMHIVAAKPLFLSKELVCSEAIKSERDILKSQAESSGKSQMAIQKMVEGRLRKYFEDVVLLEQKFVMNDSTNIKSLLDDLSKEVGSPVKIGNFLRMEVGEGIQRDETSDSPGAVAQSTESHALT